MLPLPSLDDKTYEQIVEDAIKWIPRYTPDWTDHNAHDPGITLIELFSWLTELQHYYVDQIRSDNEIKFLKLLGQKPRAAKAATTDVTFQFTDGVGTNVVIPRLTLVSTSDGKVVFETEEPFLALPVKLCKVLSFQTSGVVDYSDSNVRAGLHYSVFGQKAVAGSKLYLGFDQPFPADEQIPITFHLYENEPVARCSVVTSEDRCLWVSPSAIIEWEYYSAANGGSWIPLPIEADETLMLTFSGRIIFRAPVDASKRKVDRFKDDLYWIRATIRQAGYELPPKLDRILLNTVPVVQRMTHHNEFVGSSKGLPGQYFELSRFPILPKSIKLQVEEKSGNTLKWNDWKQVDSLDASKPSDPHYVLQAETGRLVFGDGVNGAIPQAASNSDENNLKATVYQSTSGERGNVGIFAIAKWVHPVPEFQGLEMTNWRPAVDGTASETLEDAKIRVRKQIQASHSAVTSEDYEALALSTPGLRVARTKAIPLVDRDGKPAPATVMVVVVPYSEYTNPMPSDGFIRTVCRHLHPHRLITTKLRVIPPDYVKASVDATVHIQSGYDPEATQQKIAALLLKYMHPLTGGTDGTGWPFGRPIYVSEIFDTIEKIPGVECVQNVSITASGKGIKRDAEGNVYTPPHSLIYSDAHQIDTVISEADCRPNGGCHGDKRAK